MAQPQFRLSPSPLSELPKVCPNFKNPVYQIIGVYPDIFPLYHHLQMIIFNFDGLNPDF